MGGKLVKKDGIIWFIEQQDLEGRHIKCTWMGTYEDKPKKTKQKKSGN